MSDSFRHAEDRREGDDELRYHVCLFSNRLGDVSAGCLIGRKRGTMQPNGGWIYASVWQNFAPDVFRSSLSPGVKSSPTSRHHPRKHRCTFFCWELRGKYPVGQRVHELSLRCRNLHRQVPMASLSKIPQRRRQQQCYSSVRRRRPDERRIG